MKSRYDVRFSRAAETDLINLAEYIAQDSPTAAVSVIERLRGRIESLRTLPKRGRTLPELRDFGIHNIRELVERPYRVCYRLSGHQVWVLAIFDGRRNLDDILLERLIRETRG